MDSMSSRFVAFGRIVDRKAVYFVYDRETRGEVLGRWDTREAAQEHADHCNEMHEEQQAADGPYRPVGLSSAYVAARMPDGAMSEGVGDTVEHALADANERWRAAQHG